MRRALVAGAGAAGLALLVGCTSGAESTDPSAQGAGAGSASAARPAPPTPAGSDLADLVAGLPEGAATGEVTVTLDGLGQLTGPATGTCSRDGDVTSIDVTSDTARMEFEFGPDGSGLDFHDVGVESTAVLARGDYTVDGDRFTADTVLMGQETRLGALTISLTCGG